MLLNCEYKLSDGFDKYATYKIPYLALFHLGVSQDLRRYGDVKIAHGLTQVGVS